MKFTFNYNGIYEIPLIQICNPNRTPLGYIANPHELKISPTFNDLTEMSFMMYEVEDNYDLVCKYMTLHVEGFGWFVVSSIAETNDGKQVYKEIECQSYEITLNDSSLVLYNAENIEIDPSYFLYNPASPETLQKSLLVMACNNLNGWTIGNVDASLFNKQRQFSSDSVFIYEFLMEDVQKAFGCYFVFDTENFKINVYNKHEKVIDKTEYTTNTDITLSFDNLLKNIEISENSEDICTALKVSGADGMYINDVNPLGTEYIYNFDYFKDSSRFMSEELIDAINKWESLIELENKGYDNLCEERLRLSRNYILLSAELSTLESERAALEQQRSVAIESGHNERLAEIKVDYDKKEKEIYIKNEEIKTNRNEYNQVLSQILEINRKLSFNQNFTQEQMSELKNYIKAGSYENDNFIMTELIEADADLKVEQQKQLLEQAKVTFFMLSKPLYEFSAEVSNFLFCKEYQRFIEQIELGALIHAEVKYGYWVSPRLLKIEIDYDNPESTQFVFSDNFRLQGEKYIFEDSYNDSAKVSNKVAYSSSSWDKPIKSGFYNTVEQYISSAFDLAKQEILATSDQDFQIGEYGIIGKKKLEETHDDGSPMYSDQQIRISNNLLTFTDDGWESVKTAIGRVTIGTTQMYGVVAEAIVGRLVAGEQMLITGETNSFVMNGSGCEIKNAKLEITTSDNRGKIILDPDLTASEGGICIQAYDTTKSDWISKFYVDGNGRIVAKDIKTDSGSIGGWIITENGLSDGYNNIINSDGTGKLGLMTWRQNYANFDGNIYADNLHPTLGDTTNIFNMGVGGLTMGGNWLTDGSVPLVKLSEVVCTQLTADAIEAGYIQADSILADNIKAVSGKFDTLEAEYLKTTALFAEEIDANKADIVELNTDYANIRKFLAEDGVFSGFCSWGTVTKTL